MERSSWGTTEESKKFHTTHKSNTPHQTSAPRSTGPWEPWHTAARSLLRARKTLAGFSVL